MIYHLLVRFLCLKRSHFKFYFHRTIQCILPSCFQSIHLGSYLLIFIKSKGQNGDGLTYKKLSENKSRSCLQRDRRFTSTPYSFRFRDSHNFPPWKFLNYSSKHLHHENVHHTACEVTHEWLECFESSRGQWLVFSHDWVNYTSM